MNSYYLEQAKERIPNIPVLINVVSLRVRQLNKGDRSMVKPDSPFMEKIDIALKEVAEGKLNAEMGLSEVGDVDSEKNVEKSSDKVISLG